MSDWRRWKKGPTKAEKAASEAASRAENTCPACMGDNYAAGISVSATHRVFFRRCLDCGHEPGAPERVPLEEHERLLVEWEFNHVKVLGL